MKNTLFVGTSTMSLLAREEEQQYWLWLCDYVRERSRSYVATAVVPKKTRTLIPFHCDISLATTILPIKYIYHHYLSIILLGLTIWPVPPKLVVARLGLRPIVLVGWFLRHIVHPNGVVLSHIDAVCERMAGRNGPSGHHMMGDFGHRKKERPS